MADDTLKNKLENIPLEKSVFVISIVFFVLIVIFGILRLSSVLPDGFSSDVFFSPFRMIMAIPQLKMAGIVLIPLSIVFLIIGITKSKIWFLLPAGIFIISMYWFVTNQLVINLIKRTLQ